MVGFKKGDRVKTYDGLLGTVAGHDGQYCYLVNLDNGDKKGYSVDLLESA
jgi:ribosomal protein L21E